MKKQRRSTFISSENDLLTIKSMLAAFNDKKARKWLKNKFFLLQTQEIATLDKIILIEAVNNVICLLFDQFQKFLPVGTFYLPR